MFFESLENRTLMSANTVVADDRLAVDTALLNFQTDAVAYTATILADIRRMQADGLNNDVTIPPLLVTFRTNVRTMWSQLAADNLAESETVTADRQAIAGVLSDIVTDQGNPTEEQANLALLLTDRVQLEHDEIAGLTTRLQTRKSYYTELSADLAAIATAAEGDQSASVQLQADVAQFVTDRTTCLNTMETDIQTVITARTNLADALIAQET